MQERLIELWYLNGAPTGYFGSDTETAVKKFQENNGLTVDGKIGSQTMEKLYSEDAKSNAFAYGERSDELVKYQNRLKKLGYLTTEADGTFGADTVTAVRRFQSENGLIADGALGRETATLLMSDKAESTSLKVGSEGPQVTNVQNRLIQLKYMKKATGYFGSDTEAAVRAFQKRNGLTVDGKIGPATLNKLMSDSAKKAASGSSSSSSSSSSSTKPNTGSSSSSSSSSSGSSAVITGANADSFCSVALSKLGTKYVRGGKGPNKFDCSGFVYWCLNQVGVKQSYMTSKTWRSCTKYQKVAKLSDVKRGDVIVFSGHVAIALGDGMMVDASSKNGKVVKRSCTSNWCQRQFICAFRIF